MNDHAHFSEIRTDFFRGQLKVLKEGAGDEQKRFFWPTTEPIKCTAID
jgi:hypothetical protein